jgi:hypothetical protein
MNGRSYTSLEMMVNPPKHRNNKSRKLFIINIPMGHPLGNLMGDLMRREGGREGITTTFPLPIHTDFDAKSPRKICAIKSRNFSATQTCRAKPRDPGALKPHAKYCLSPTRPTSRQLGSGQHARHPRSLRSASLAPDSHHAPHRRCPRILVGFFGRGVTICQITHSFRIRASPQRFLRWLDRW